MPRKVMDVSRLQALGWQAKVPLEEGFKRAYEWYARNAGDQIALDIFAAR
jgi:GDP-L-fucose synthase